jgi:hypothetical protein
MMPRDLIPRFESDESWTLPEAIVLAVSVFALVALVYTFVTAVATAA